MARLFYGASEHILSAQWVKYCRDAFIIGIEHSPLQLNTDQLAVFGVFVLRCRVKITMVKADSS